MFFNFEENAISTIDNRMLTNNPFTSNTAGLTASIEAYVSDRIGFRDALIRDYIILNDRLFNIMIHPMYEYGTDGEVFFSKMTGGGSHLSDYHKAFMNFIVSMQTFCDERSIPFVFVFDPIKNSVISDKLPKGINYDNGWVKEFMEELNNMKVNYIDNTKTLKEKYLSGEQVFNQKYNAGHWNDLGAFYGVNEVLKNLQTYFPLIHVNTFEDYTITSKLNTTLPVSEFPIYEYEPLFINNESVENVTSQYKSNVILHPSFQYFYYTINNKQKNNSPKTLVFQGSYMNGMGYKFLENSLSEYIAIHNYQNVLNYKYYFELFEPECVIFEVAEYTVNNSYFDYDLLKQ